MSMASDDHNEQSIPPTVLASLHDVKAYIKGWGRCGLFLGANLGVILGAFFVAVPFTAEITTLSLVRTLLVGVIACTVMAGAFAALAAALYSKTRNHFLSAARVRAG